MKVRQVQHQMAVTNNKNSQFCRTRRTFCRFIATSPLLGGAAVFGTSDASAGRIGSDEPGLDLPDMPLIQAPDEALNVFDLEAVARHKLPPAHYGQIATAAGSGRTLVRNREAFGSFGIEARRMVGVSKVDTSIEMFGTRFPYPLMLSPVGSHRMADPEGELATARGAASRNATMIMSTFSSTAIEKVIDERGEPVWYQLYPNTEWKVTRALVKRASRAGCRVIVCTVDGVGGGRREIFERFVRMDKRDCSACHAPGSNPYSTAPMFDGLDLKGAGQLGAAIDWNFIRSLREETDRKLLLKGILTAQDALLAIDAGADGMIVSNHGGRVFDSGVSTLEVLPEIVSAVAGRVPVLIDSGFRRGTDVFKALALGAKAVCIGRPYMWGLAAFGAEGVATALGLITTEFQQTMRQAGTLTTRDIDATRIRRL